MRCTEENRFAVISEISVKNFRVFGVVRSSTHPPPFFSSTEKEFWGYFDSSLRNDRNSFNRFASGLG
jgi:hypothetical protein